MWNLVCVDVNLSKSFFIFGYLECFLCGSFIFVSRKILFAYDLMRVSEGIGVGTVMLMMKRGLEWYCGGILLIG